MILKKYLTMITIAVGMSFIAPATSFAAVSAVETAQTDLTFKNSTSIKLTVSPNADFIPVSQYTGGSDCGYNDAATYLDGRVAFTDGTPGNFAIRVMPSNNLQSIPTEEDGLRYILTSDDNPQHTVALQLSFPAGSPNEDGWARSAFRVASPKYVLKGDGLECVGRYSLVLQATSYTL